MRQQYHRRHTPNGKYVWDVFKLIDASAALPIIEVSLSNIKELGENYWFDGDDDEAPTCKAIAMHAQLMHDADLRYLIILCADGRVMDGMHRICKAYASGEKTIKAKQFTTTPEPDFINVSLNDLPYEDKEL